MLDNFKIVPHEEAIRLIDNGEDPSIVTAKLALSELWQIEHIYWHKITRNQTDRAFILLTIKDRLRKQMDDENAIEYRLRKVENYKRPEKRRELLKEVTEKLQVELIKADNAYFFTTEERKVRNINEIQNKVTDAIETAINAIDLATDNLKSGIKLIQDAKSGRINLRYK